jgi:hypothetical protein
MKAGDFRQVADLADVQRYDLSVTGVIDLAQDEVVAMALNLYVMLLEHGVHCCTSERLLKKHGRPVKPRSTRLDKYAGIQSRVAVVEHHFN